MRTWSKNPACGTFCLISLACGAFCFIKNLACDAFFTGLNNAFFNVKNPLSNQTSWDTNRTTPFQSQNNLLETTYVNTCNIIVTNTRLISIQVGESCPPNALRPLPRPPTPASQYLWQNKTIQWLLLPSSLPSPTVSYRDCRVLMHSAES